LITLPEPKQQEDVPFWPHLQRATY
jgi:hypothetical protein